MILKFSLYVFFFLLFGFLPLYSIFGLLKKIDKSHRIIFSLGFAPILISAYNVINILLGIENSILMYILPSLSAVISVSYSYRNQAFEDIFSQDKSRMRLIAIGIIFGAAYWFIFFYKYYINGVLYPDVTYNLGIISELKLNFPPVDPHWYTGRFLNYHFLTQIFIAGMSNFIGVDVISSMHFTNLITAISVFVILSLYIEKGIVEKLMSFLIFIFISFSNEWIPSSAIYSHLTGASASTFFWSLPILITLLIVWEFVNKYRFLILYKYLTLIFLLCTIFLFYAKGPFVFVFVILEFIVFIKFLFSEFSKSKINIEILLKAAKYFIWCPVFTVLLIFLSRNASNTLTLGIEIRDFALFKSWNPIYPIFVIYAILITTIIVGIKNFNKIRIEYLFCSIFYFIMFLIYKHPGYSDLDFLFMAIILNSFLLISSKIDSLLRNLILSIFVINFIVFFFVLKHNDRGFNTIDFKLDRLTNIPIDGDSVKSPRIKELLEFSKKLPDKSLIAVPKNSDDRFFCYSAFIGRRIWNENNLYSFRTNSVYTSIRLFQKQEGFIPSYLKDVPLIDDRNMAYKKFISKGNYMDTVKYELADKRWLVYNRCVFDSLSVKDYLSVVKEKKWTHILVENIDVKKVNYWIKDLKYIRGEYYTIFICP